MFRIIIMNNNNNQINFISRCREIIIQSNVFVKLIETRRISRFFFIDYCVVNKMS